MSDVIEKVKVSDSACKRIDEKRAELGAPDMCLRITVDSGGCSGFEYQFSLDKTVNDDDHVFGDRVIIDSISLDLLKGSTIDYVEELIGADFKILNPNATAGCGCGHSFSINT